MVEFFVTLRYSEAQLYVLLSKKHYREAFNNATVSPHTLIVNMAIVNRHILHLTSPPLNSFLYSSMIISHHTPPQFRIYPHKETRYFEQCNNNQNFYRD